MSRPGVSADICYKLSADERWFQDLSYMFDLNMYTYLGMCLTMTYLRKYAYTSLGMSFLMGAFAQVFGPPFSTIFSATLHMKTLLSLTKGAHSTAKL
jgi:hypothetical protein